MKALIDSAADFLKELLKEILLDDDSKQDKETEKAAHLRPFLFPLT